MNHGKKRDPLYRLLFVLIGFSGAFQYGNFTRSRMPIVGGIVRSQLVYFDEFTTLFMRCDAENEILLKLFDNGQALLILMTIYNIATVSLSKKILLRLLNSI